MHSHEFQPGRLLTGLTLLAVGVVYGGDAFGRWEAPWWTAVPLTFAGLFVAAVAAFTTYRVRLRARSQASTENTEAPASSRVNQPMR
ncbi:hypothetical protein [Streptomyces sp. NPDC060194]|uniref:hypothetical protein n=1 Tax=Streptomyces sp. NPDC060194 TaxID=3347069 RepID=UPI0036501844